MNPRKWYLLSLIGKDRPGIVAKLSAGLCKNGCNLGDSSMARLGNNFVIMLAVQFDGSQEALENIVMEIIFIYNSQKERVFDRLRKSFES